MQDLAHKKRQPGIRRVRSLLVLPLLFLDEGWQHRQPRLLLTVDFAYQLQESFVSSREVSEESLFDLPFLNLSS